MPGQDAMRVELWTVWGRWADEDVVELMGAVDQWTHDANPDALAELVAGARKRVGAENVQLARVQVPWSPIADAFDEVVVVADSPTVQPVQEARDE